MFQCEVQWQMSLGDQGPKCKTTLVNQSVTGSLVDEGKPSKRVTLDVSADDLQD